MPTTFFEPTELKDIKTTAQVNRYYAEQCTTAGLEVSITTLILAVTVVPLALRKHHHFIPIRNEYKLAIGAISAMVGSYVFGSYFQSRCEKRVKKELAEHFAQQ